MSASNSSINFTQSQMEMLGIEPSISHNFVGKVYQKIDLPNSEFLPSSKAANKKYKKMGAPTPYNGNISLKPDRNPTFNSSVLAGSPSVLPILQKVEQQIESYKSQEFQALQGYAVNLNGDKTPKELHQKRKVLVYQYNTGKLSPKDKRKESEITRTNTMLVESPRYQTEHEELKEPTESIHDPHSPHKSASKPQMSSMEMLTAVVEAQKAKKFYRNAKNCPQLTSVSKSTHFQSSPLKGSYYTRSDKNTMASKHGNSYDIQTQQMTRSPSKMIKLNKSVESVQSHQSKASKINLPNIRNSDLQASFSRTRSKYSSKQGMFSKEERQPSSYLKAHHQRYNSQNLVSNSAFEEGQSFMAKKSSLKDLDGVNSTSNVSGKKIQFSRDFYQQSGDKPVRRPLASKISQLSPSLRQHMLNQATIQSTLMPDTSANSNDQFQQFIHLPSASSYTRNQNLEKEKTAEKSATQTIKLVDSSRNTPDLTMIGMNSSSVQIIENQRLDTIDSFKKGHSVIQNTDGTQIAEQTIQDLPFDELDSKITVEFNGPKKAGVSKRSSIDSMGQHLDSSFLPISNSTLQLVNNLNPNIKVLHNNSRAVSTLQDKKSSTEMTSNRQLSIDSLQKRFKRIRDKQLQHPQIWKYKPNGRNFPVRSQRVSAALNGVPYFKWNLKEDPKTRFKERDTKDSKEAQAILNEIKDRQLRKLDIQKALLEQKNKIFGGRHDNLDFFRDGDKYNPENRMRVYDLKDDSHKVASPVSSNIRLNTHKTGDEDVNFTTSSAHLQTTAKMTDNDLFNTQNMSDINQSGQSEVPNPEPNQTHQINFEKGFEFTHPRKKFLDATQQIQQEVKEKSKTGLAQRTNIYGTMNVAHKTQNFEPNYSLRWKDSVRKFTALPQSPVGQKPKKIKVPILTSILLYLVLLPNNSVKHAQIIAQCVKIKSPNFYKAREVDFLELCAKIFNQKSSLNFLYDQDGELINSLVQIKPKSLIFVKHDPGFNLTEKDFAQVVRSLDRNQRTREKSTVKIEEIDDNDLSKYQTASNYLQLVVKKIQAQNEPKTFYLKSQDPVSKQAVKNKLYKYANKVMKMEEKLKFKEQKHYIDTLLEIRDLVSKEQRAKYELKLNEVSGQETPPSVVHSPLVKLSREGSSENKLATQMNSKRNSSAPHESFDLSAAIKAQSPTSAVSVEQRTLQQQYSAEELVSPRFIEYDKEQFNLINSSFDQTQQVPGLSKDSSSFRPDNKFKNLARRSVTSFKKLQSNNKTRQQKLWDSVESRIEKLRAIHGMTLSDTSSDDIEYQKYKTNQLKGKKLYMDQDPDDPAFNTDEYFKKIERDLDTSDLYTNEKKLGELYKALDQACEKEKKATQKNLVRFAPHHFVDKPKKPVAKDGDFYEDIVTRNKIKYMNMNKRIDKIFKSNYKRLLWLNMPKLQSEMKMDREHQIHNYMLWFAMTRLCALQETNTHDLRDLSLKPYRQEKLKQLIMKGVSTDVIRKSIPMLQLESERFTEIMVDTILERSTKFVNIDPTEFIKTMRGVMHASFEERLEVFFKMIDEDGNGELSWDELYELSYRSLNVFGDEALEESTIAHLESMASFFASYTFKIAGVSEEDEIPLPYLKDKIINGDREEAIILSILMGA